MMQGAPKFVFGLGEGQYVICWERERGGRQSEEHGGAARPHSRMQCFCAHVYMSLICFWTGRATACIYDSSYGLSAWCLQHSTCVSDSQGSPYTGAAAWQASACTCAVLHVCTSLKRPCCDPHDAPQMLSGSAEGTARFGWVSSMLVVSSCCQK